MVFINPLSEAVTLLQQFGLFTVILPAILIFALFYGIFTKVPIFGAPTAENNVRSIYAIISAVGALLVITQTKIVEFINNIIPSASALLVVIMLVLMVLGFLGMKVQDEPWGENKHWSIYVVLIIVGLIFLGMIDMALGWNIPIIHDLVQLVMGQIVMEMPSQDVINMMVTIAVLIAVPVAVLYFILRSPSTPGKP